MPPFDEEKAKASPSSSSRQEASRDPLSDTTSIPHPDSAVAATPRTSNADRRKWTPSRLHETPTRTHAAAAAAAVAAAISSADSPIRHRPGKGKSPLPALVESHRDIGSVNRVPSSSLRPPSFAESQFATIIRRQRKNRVVSPAANLLTAAGTPAFDLEAYTPAGPRRAPTTSEHDDPFTSDSGWSGALRRGELKAGWNYNADAPTTTLTTDRQHPLMAIHRAWEFAGWGSISLLELPNDPPSQSAAEATASTPQSVQLGQWKASAIAGNAVTGSVFYALPAVVAVSSVLSPISMLVACLLLYPFRPIVCELASALSASNAGNYSYLSNISSKLVAVLAAAMTLLDAIATGAVSAGTASAYIAGETATSHAHLDYRLVSVLLLVGLALLCLLGMRDSSSVALSMFLLHLVTMAMLLVAGTVAWIRSGNAVLANNWSIGMASLRTPGTGKGIARAIFDGVCVAFVGLTGFECSPSYINQVKPGEFPRALRNLHLITVVTEAPLMLLVLALVPMDAVLGGSNVLALLGQVAGRGAFLKLFVVVDACIVLCGGIITGIVAFCGLLDALCDDRVVPSALQKRLPRTGATYISIALFLVLTLVMSATCSFNLSTLSSVFSVSFLCIMTLFGVSLVLLKYARPSLPRSPTTSLGMALLGIAIGIVAMAGNFALAPVIIGPTLAYFGVLAAVLVALTQRVNLARILVWLVEQQRSSKLVRLSPRLEKQLIGWIRSERRHPVIYFTKSDDISVLVNALYYIQRNEPTSNCKLVHCYKRIEDLPDQLDETFQLVDEIFPTVTVDLVFVEAPFTPDVVRATCKQLQVPVSRSFISCPSGHGAQIGSLHPLAAYGGLRIILP